MIVSQCVLVIGHPRSGSSCVSSVLSRLGVRMTLAKFVPPSTANRLGFFEDAELTEHLAHFARPIPCSGEKLEQWHARNACKLAAIPRLILARCEGGRLWGAKTHSLAYCLPVVKAACVMPVKIIRTTRAIERSQRSADKSIGHHYDCEAISNQVDAATDGLLPCVVDYDDMLARPRHAVERIAEHVGVAFCMDAVDVIDANERTIWP